MNTLRQFSVLPGFGLSLGYTLVYLSLIVLVPISAIFIFTCQLSLSEYWQVVASCYSVLSIVIWHIIFSGCH